MNWFEELPLDCPPQEAFSPEKCYFRLGVFRLTAAIFGRTAGDFRIRFFRLTNASLVHCQFLMIWKLSSN